jgi:hypothetical protein
MRTGRISGSRRTRQQVGLQQFALRLKPRFIPFRDSARAAPSLCGGSVDSRAIFLRTKLVFLKPCRGTVRAFCEHLSPGDEPACHPQPKSLRQVERNPFNAGATIWRTTAHHLATFSVSRLSFDLRWDAPRQSVWRQRCGVRRWLVSCDRAAF